MIWIQSNGATPREESITWNVIALKASPDSWLVSTTTPSFSAGIIKTCETYPGRPPV